MDVNTAFLNAPIDCELYVEQPEGYEIKSKNDEKLVLRLKKSLYGLKRSGRNWNHTLHTYLIEQGYSQSHTDSCVYKKHSEGQPDDYTIVVIWVDDLLLATKHESTMTNEKDKLKQKFRMKDRGKISWFLGIEFAHEHEKITMCQARYIERLLNARLQTKVNTM